MEVSLSPDQEARVRSLAAQRGAEAADVVRSMVQQVLDYEDWFATEVDKGLTQADRGELVDHAEVVRRMEARLAGR